MFLISYNQCGDAIAFLNSLFQERILFWEIHITANHCSLQRREKKRKNQGVCSTLGGGRTNLFSLCPAAAGQCLGADCGNNHLLLLFPCWRKPHLLQCCSKHLKRSSRKHRPESVSNTWCEPLLSRAAYTEVTLGVFPAPSQAVQPGMALQGHWRGLLLLGRTAPSSRSSKNLLAQPRSI